MKKKCEKYLNVARVWVRIVLFLLFRKQLKCYSEEQVGNTNIETAYLGTVVLHINKKSNVFKKIC